ncbi:hypothetical protein PGTUg99_000135 [Puccinia graminis f. sp. tritici]|uniref:Uncharacterized protein n=1 Tax=Puccinia graminis f. sp. tritici TaxID=56615 RepID=A0A5B0PPP6_PUCGR|nr:hypothetical protein PGTUg99_000135 [Puccinia graminis f. sp. tritici]
MLPSPKTLVSSRDYARNHRGLEPLDAPLPLSHCSPPTDNSRPSLASPLAVQSHTNELVSQLLLRIEQLERKTVKQDQEIHQLKANISLVGAQSQREHQANVKLVNNVPSGSNLFR